MKLELNKDEQIQLIAAIGSAIASARRQQKTSPQPQIREVYAAQERSLLMLQGKIAEAK